jgi:TRAP-type C4-dicarboxylate transport system substrate-binding protein
MNIPGALSTFTLIMNRRAYDGLSDAQRAILDTETGPNLSLKAAWAFQEAGARGIEKLREAKVELISLDDTALAEFETAMQGPIRDFLVSEGKAAGFDGPALVDGFRRKP